MIVYLVAEGTPEAAGRDPSAKTSGTDLTLAEVVTNLRRVLAESTTWVIAVMLFCSVGMLITLLALWGVPYIVQTYDLRVTTASWFTLFGSVGLLVGPPAFGWISDRFARRSVFILRGGTG